MPVVKPDVAQRGAGLIEVLIAVVILSIGLLASAGMQAGSLRANQDSQFLGQAGTLLETMVDRIRANPEGVAGGFYDGTDTSTPRSAACLAIECTPAGLAGADIARWRDALVPPAGELPSLPPRADGSPALGTISASADGLYTLTLTWSALVGGSVVDRSLDTSFRP